MQTGQPAVAQTESMRRNFWFIIVGAALVMVGLLLVSAVFFAFAIRSEALFGIGVQVIYAVEASGYALAAVGFFLALLGIARAVRSRL